MAAQGNLILIFTVFVIYSFLGWGIAQLYSEQYDELSTNPMGESEGFDFITLVMDTGGVMTYQDSRIPIEVKVLVITPLNMLMVGAFIYWVRGGGT